MPDHSLTPQGKDPLPASHAALLSTDFLLGPDGRKFLAKYGLDSAMNKPDFKRRFAEAGMTVSITKKRAPSERSC